MIIATSLSGFDKFNLSPLISSQNAAAKIIFLAGCFDHVNLPSASLHWFPHHIKQKPFVFTLKALHNQSPPCLSSSTVELSALTLDQSHCLLVMFSNKALWAAIMLVCTLERHTP